MIHCSINNLLINYEFQKVAVIGTGCTSVQLVPEIVDDVARLTIFQRSPPWVVPKSSPIMGGGSGKKTTSLIQTLLDFAERKENQYFGDWSWIRMTTRNKW